MIYPPPADMAEIRTASAAAHIRRAFPPLFHDATTDNPQIQAWAQRLTRDPAHAGNLVILGPVGAGKTWAAHGAIRAAVMGRAARGRLCAWHATTHARMLAAMRPGPHETDAGWFADRDLLMIDDIGAVKGSEWAAEQLDAIADERHTHQRPTIITSNLGPDEMLHAIGSRSVSRLTGGATVVILDGPDRRMGGRS